MNTCRYCGNQSDSDVTHCPSCGTDLSEPTPETLAFLVSRLNYRQMFLAPLWALQAALFLPSGLILLLLGNHIYQRAAATVFLALGTLSIIVGRRVHHKLAGPPNVPSRCCTFTFVATGLLFFVAIGGGLFIAVFLLYIFSGGR